MSVNINHQLEKVNNLLISPIGTGATVGTAGIVTYYGDGSQLEGVVTSIIAGSNITLNGGPSGDVTVNAAAGAGADGTDFNTGLTTTKYHSASNDIDGYNAIGFSFTGKSLITSIHVTNVSTGDLYVTSRIDYNGGDNVPLTNKVLVPYQGALEIIDESLVASTSDQVRFAAYSGIATNSAGVTNGLDCFITYESKTSTTYIGTGSTIVDTIDSVGYAQTVHTATAFNEEVINTIVLTNYSDASDVDVSVSIYRNGTIQQGYLVYNLTVPQNSSVQILPKAKVIHKSDTIVVNASTPNVVGVHIGARKIS